MRNTVLLILVVFAFAQVSSGQLPPRNNGTPFPLPSQSRVPTTGHSMSTSLPRSSLPNTSGGFTPPKSYSDFYNSSLKEYHRPPSSARDYTIDQHFYHRPTVSPYLNLARRPASTGLGNYQQYVRPELDRRATANAVPRSNPGAAKFSPYYNKMYGQR